MKFREFITSNNLTVYGGKSAENNEDLINQAGPKETVLHTAMPGSPFCNIKGTPTKKDISEAAVFCAKYSQDWRDRKTEVSVHVFKGSNITKNKLMKQGTFGVKKFDVIKVKKADILKFEEELTNVKSNLWYMP